MKLRKGVIPVAALVGLTHEGGIPRLPLFEAWSPVAVAGGCADFRPGGCDGGTTTDVVLPVNALRCQGNYSGSREGSGYYAAPCDSRSLPNEDQTEGNADTADSQTLDDEKNDGFGINLVLGILASVLFYFQHTTKQHPSKFQSKDKVFRAVDGGTARVKQSAAFRLTARYLKANRFLVIVMMASFLSCIEALRTNLRGEGFTNDQVVPNVQGQESIGSRWNNGKGGEPFDLDDIENANGTTQQPMKMEGEVDGGSKSGSTDVEESFSLAAEHEPALSIRGTSVETTTDIAPRSLTGVESDYQLRAELQGPKCPDALEVQESECLAAALQVGAKHEPETWLNAFDLSYTPCGCFLWQRDSDTVYVDYDRGQVGECGTSDKVIGMVCKESDYQLRAELRGPKCPHGLEIQESECLAAALQVGAQHKPDTNLHANDWSHTPCGCFLWGKGSDTVYVDYDRGQVGECGISDKVIGMVCKKEFSPFFQAVAIGTAARGEIDQDQQVSTKTIRGAGANIWGTADSFYFYKQAISADSYLSQRFEIEMYTESGLDRTYLPSWAKFGIMVRDSLRPSSRHFTAVFTGNGNGVRSYYRSSDGGSTKRTVGPLGRGGWLKIERNGDKFRAYYKADPTSDDQKTFYQMFAEATISMGKNVHVGVAICSTNSNLVSANFERFTLKESMTVWSRAIGPGADGSLSGADKIMDGRDVDITGQGVDIWGTEDSFFYSSVNVPDSDIGKVFSVEVFTQDGFGGQQAYHWAKFGLMVRDGLDPSSKHFSIFLSQGRGVHAFHRSDAGGSTSIIIGNSEVRGGGWLRIDRAGDVFRAFYRKDDAPSYTLIGQATVPMGGSVEVGIALSSHETDALDTVRFSLFALEIGASPNMFVAQDTSRSTCLKWHGEGKALTTSPCFYSDSQVGVQYFESTGQLSAGSHSLSNTDIISTADMYIQGGTKGSNNYGTHSSIVVKNDPSPSWTRVAFLQFGNIDSNFANLAAIKLRLYVLGAGTDESRSITVARMPSDFVLRETSATWDNTVQDFGITASSKLKVDASHKSQWVEVDISDLLVSGGDLTLALVNQGQPTSQNWVSFGSRENTDHEPRLVLSARSMCVQHSTGEPILSECSLEEKNQRWVFYNNEFFLSLDSSKRLSASGETKWTKGSSVPYHPMAVVLSGSRGILHSSLCLEEVESVVTLRYCAVSSKKQQWAMDDDGLIKNKQTGKCVSRRYRGAKASGMALDSVSCHDADEWHWRDGSLYLDSDEEYLIQSNEAGQVIMGYIPNERSRRPNQRWLVGSKRYSTYHRSTNSIRVRNEAAYPVECSLKQLGPLYWGVIYPGEEFYRNTGAVHFSVRCAAVLDGVGMVRIGDAIWPIADLVVAILVSVVTLGAASGASASMVLAAQTATGTLATGVMTMMKTNDFSSVLESMAIAAACTVGAGASITAIQNRIIGLAAAKTAAEAATKVGTSISSAAASMKKVSLQAFKNKVAPAVSDAVKVGQKPTSSRLSNFVAKSPVSPGDGAVDVMTNVGISTSLTLAAGVSSEYANGKLFVVRGGLSAMANGDMREEPLRLERYESNRKLALEQCEWDSDCLNNGCGRLARGDDELYCCGEVGLFGGLDYCLGTAMAGEHCWFDEQCEGEGYCEGTCQTAKKIGETCDNDDECQNSVAHCDGNCIKKTGNFKECTSNSHCLSGGCGRDSSKGKFSCCESGQVFNVKDLDGASDFCTGTKPDKATCYQNEHCESGYCMGSNGLSVKYAGKCLGPYEVGEDCSEGKGEDDQCYSKECGLEEAGSSKYVCCADEAIEHASLDYCNRLEDGKQCWLDVMCESGYCAANGGGTQKGQCIKKHSKNVGEECYAGRDDICKVGLECGKKDYWNQDTYVCCEDAFAPAGWTTDLCVVQTKGTRCGTTEDRECAGNMGCALDERGGKYICCHDVGTYGGYDYCYGMANGKSCHSDAMCASDFCDGTCKSKKSEGKACPSEKNAECWNDSCYRSTRHGDYKCCGETNFCYLHTSGCDTGFFYCANHGDRLG